MAAEGEEAPLEDNSHSEKDSAASDHEGSVEPDSASSPCSESKCGGWEEEFISSVCS